MYDALLYYYEALNYEIGRKITFKNVFQFLCIDSLCTCNSEILNIHVII